MANEELEEKRARARKERQLKTPLFDIALFNAFSRWIKTPQLSKQKLNDLDIIIGLQRAENTENTFSSLHRRFKI